MLNIEVNRSAEGVERYFDRELGERLLDERARDMGGTRGGTARTAWSNTTFAVRSVVAKRKSDDG
jgi:hypothetical protein